MSRTTRIAAADGHLLEVYVRAPAGTPRAGLVVLQEIFGLNQHIRGVADSYAEAGFLAVAPALFDRVQRNAEFDYDDLAPGRAVVAQLDERETMLDIAAAISVATEAGRVFVVGYCWGGTLAYQAASRFPVLAAACYYGRGIVNVLAETPRCPVIYHYGMEDPHIPLNDVKCVRAVRSEGIFHLYEGAGHGFNCESRKDYRPAAAALARRRTLSLFDAVL
jgi:carboxymethylenebutenolidase